MQYDLKHLPTPTQFCKDAMQFARTSSNKQALLTAKVKKNKVDKKKVTIDLQYLSMLCMFASKIATVYAYEFIDECAERYAKSRQMLHYIKGVEKRFDLWESSKKRIMYVDENQWAQACMSASVDILRPYVETFFNEVKSAVYQERVSDSKLYTMGEVADALLLLATITFKHSKAKNAGLFNELNAEPLLKCLAVLNDKVRADKFKGVGVINFDKYPKVQEALTQVGYKISDDDTFIESYKAADDFCGIKKKDE